jgi:hypothetical protein
VVELEPGTKVILKKGGYDSATFKIEADKERVDVVLEKKKTTSSSNKNRNGGGKTVDCAKTPSAPVCQLED